MCRRSKLAENASKAAENAKQSLNEQALLGSAPKEPPKEYEVSFPEDGRLGIQFRDMKAPYIVGTVHPGCLASDSGIEPGHVLLKVNGIEIVNQDWKTEMVALMKTRPLTLDFRADTAGASLTSGLMDMGTRMWAATG
jgi:predicted metalloprotease with PDZ domain